MKLNLERKAVEWTVIAEPTFSVLVRGWGSKERFCWNVYACIFQGHPLHNQPALALDLPLHGGPTYDKRIITSPANDEPSRWNAVSDVLKVGSDYAHYQDDYEGDDPSDGIPLSIQRDALELGEHLAALQVNMQVPA